MSRTTTSAPDEQVRRLWDLVGELGTLSDRLQVAADKAVESLEKNDEQRKEQP